MHSTDLRFFVFINGYSVPFLSNEMLVLLIALHKQILLAAGNYPTRAFLRKLRIQQSYSIAAELLFCGETAQSPRQEAEPRGASLVFFPVSLHRQNGGNVP